MKIMAGRKLVLDRAAQAVLRDRQREHGKPENTFETHAQLFSVYLTQKTGHAINLQPEDIARLMILFKIGRSMANNQNGDNWIDIAGYAACGSEIAAAMVEFDASVDLVKDDAKQQAGKLANGVVPSIADRVGPVFGVGGIGIASDDQGYSLLSGESIELQQARRDIAKMNMNCS